MVRSLLHLTASPQALPLAGRLHLPPRGCGTGPRGRPLRRLPAVPLHRLRITKRASSPSRRATARTWRSAASSHPFEASRPPVRVPRTSNGWPPRPTSPTRSCLGTSRPRTRGWQRVHTPIDIIENVLIQAAGDALFTATEAPQALWRLRLKQAEPARRWGGVRQAGVNAHPPAGSAGARSASTKIGAFFGAACCCASEHVFCL